MNYILDNVYTYFVGEIAKGELIRTKIEDLPEEVKEFKFQFVWFR